MRRASTAVLVLAFALPLGYVGSVAAVLAHEGLGHGLTAAALGGRFHRLWVDLDLMGAASTTSPPEHRVAVLAAGIIATTVLGLLLVVWARRARRPLAGIAIAVFAVTFLHEGPPYAFWNAVFPAGSGDVTRILRHVGADARTALIAVTAAVYVACTWLSHLALFRRVEDILGPLSAGAAFALGATIAAVVAAGYLAFDWEVLLGISTAWPWVGALALGLAVAGLLTAIRRRELAPSQVPVRLLARDVAFSWAGTGLTILLIVLRLSKGVSFD
jgi:hypothetical protein